MKNKDLIMIGIIIGIIFFFIGLMISNVFPSDSENLVSYKVAAFMKLIGIGILVTSMVIGGLIINSIDKNLRMLLFLFGLILLIIYTVGSPLLNWSIDEDFSGIPGGSDSEEAKEEAYDNRPTSLGTPGFEIISIFVAIGLLFTLKKIKKG